MIRSIALLTTLAFAPQALAASPAPAPAPSVAPPALIQCISAAMSGSTDDNAPLITDCVSVGSTACRNALSDTSDPTTVKCDGEERQFWEALLSFEMTTLQKSLKADGLRSLRNSQRAWEPWRTARCDFVKKSEAGRKQMEVDVSFCMMETTALRAIDLMYAL